MSEPTEDLPYAVEAMRVVAAVQDWARRSFPEAGPGPDGHTGSDCQWCPLCQFVAVLRGDRPELTERVAEAGAAFASAFKAMIDAAATNAAGTTPRSAQSPAPPRVQRIDLDEPDEPTESV
ncbi:MAG TPA: hypothetical protein VJ831_15440 [Jatrophihabitantaceae bacterium]|nr:hypothetical protein [Jatrophihabitantaceae bacterium]